MINSFLGERPVASREEAGKAGESVNGYDTSMTHTLIKYWKYQLEG